MELKLSLLGAVNVRKQRYLMRSNARTLPSNDAVNKTLPLFANSQAVTPEVCSVKVTMQKPLAASHTLILPSSAQVMILSPEGEYVSALRLSKGQWPFHTDQTPWLG